MSKQFIKIFLTIVFFTKSYALEAYLFDDQSKSGSSETSGVFQNEKYNYHYKCGANPSLNKKSFANLGVNSFFSSQVNKVPVVAIMLPSGEIKYFPNNLYKSGADRIKFKIGDDLYYGKAGASGWLIGKGVKFDDQPYKEIALKNASDLREQAFHYEDQLAKALDKYASNKAKNTANSLSDDQLINCSKLSAKTANKTFQAALAKITDIETKESFREIASEQKKYLEKHGGSEGGTTGGTSGMSR